MIFAIPIPGLGISTTTLFIVPCAWYALLKQPQLQRPSLALLYLLLAVGVFTSGLLLGAVDGVYLNFLVWIVNAYASFILLSHPHGRTVAFGAWAAAVGVLVLLRGLELFAGLSVELFDRNGYAFFIVLFMAPLYAEVLKRFSRAHASAALLLILVVLLLNASRGGVVCGLAIAYLLHVEAGRRQPLAPVRQLGFALLLAMFLSAGFLLSSYSPLLQSQAEWIQAIYETGSQDELYEGGGGTVEVRSQLAARSLEVFRESPFTGAGLFRGADVIDVAALRIVLGSGEVTQVREHNSYLLWLSETGLAGTIPFAGVVLFVIGGILRCWRVRRTEKEPYLFVALCVSSATLFELLLLGNITASGTWSALMTAPAAAWGHRLRGRL